MNKIQPGSLLPTEDVTNSKVATVFLTLGLQLQKPGIYVTLTKEFPQSTGGQAHFLFESNSDCSVSQYLKIYNANKADEVLDDHILSLKESGVLSAEQTKQLELRIAEAIIVWGRKLLDNYQIVVKTVKEDVARFCITPGDPVYSDGKLAGLQNFTFTPVRK